MPGDLIVLVWTAVTLGVLHTLVGPDHYVPFIAMSRSGRWSLSKTALITVLCGIGHVLSSVILGAVGIGLGLAVSHLEAFETWRGNIAAWLLIGFGLIYTAWGIRHSWRNRPHEHGHIHADAEAHVHTHTHTAEHAHVHPAGDKKSMTPWVLFVVFVFGPCEVLIPLLMYPAAQHSLAGLVIVTATFGLATIATMLTVVLAGRHALHALPTARLERHMHALAGATILMCGLAIQFLGL